MRRITLCNSQAVLNQMLTLHSFWFCSLAHHWIMLWMVSATSSSLTMLDLFIFYSFLVLNSSPSNHLPQIAQISPLRLTLCWIWRGVYLYIFMLRANNPVVPKKLNFEKFRIGFYVQDSEVAITNVEFHSKCVPKRPMGTYNK